MTPTKWLNRKRLKLGILSLPAGSCWFGSVCSRMGRTAGRTSPSHTFGRRTPQRSYSNTTHRRGTGLDKSILHSCPPWCSSRRWSSLYIFKHRKKKILSRRGYFAVLKHQPWKQEYLVMSLLRTFLRSRHWVIPQVGAQNCPQNHPNDLQPSGHQRASIILT